MSVEVLLAQLDGVKQTGPGRWVARCPAHEDRSPSLSVREVEDGRVLVHCFAGCSADAIVESVGLRLSDLMPPRPLTSTFLPSRSGLKPAEALMLCAHEVNVAVMLVDAMAGNAAVGEAPSRAAVDRLLAVAFRLAKVRGLVRELNR